MSKGLVIVESPAKVKSIQKFLGKNYIVKSSVGHIRDLSKQNKAVEQTKRKKMKIHSCGIKVNVTELKVPAAHLHYQ